MNILLISVNKEIEPYHVYPLGMSVVAHAIENAGHSVCQRDILVSGEESILQDIKSGGYELIGLSLRNIDNVDSLTENSRWSLKYVKELIEKIKRITVAPVFIGGAGFSVMPTEAFTYIGADFGISGEGETAVLEMIAALPDRTKKIFSSTPVRIGRAKIDSEIIRYYIDKSGVINIQTKRGCPHKCGYCTYPLLEGKKIRARDIGEVIEDIKALQKYSGIDEIFFTDSVFNDIENNWLELADAIAVSGIKIKWSAFFEPTHITKDALRLCVRSGLKSVELGTDATTDETLRGLAKPFTMDDIFAFNELCSAEKLPVAHFVIFGGPNETSHTLEKGVENIGKLHNSILFGFLGVRLYKNTPIYSRALAEGIVSATDDLLKPTYYFSPQIDKTTAEKYLTKAFKGNRTRLFPPSKGHAQMAIALELGFKGTLWDKLIRY